MGLLLVICIGGSHEIIFHEDINAFQAKRILKKHFYDQMQKKELYMQDLKETLMIFSIMFLISFRKIL